MGNATHNNVRAVIMSAHARHFGKNSAAASTIPVFVSSSISDFLSSLILIEALAKWDRSNVLVSRGAPVFVGSNGSRFFRRSMEKNPFGNAGGPTNFRQKKAALSGSKY